VGRLEAEIRFVVEGRQPRGAAPGHQLREQAVQWADREQQDRDEAGAPNDLAMSWPNTAGEQEELLAAQLEEQATQRVPDL
jgi:hypothetical protein